MVANTPTSSSRRRVQGLAGTPLPPRAFQRLLTWVPVLTLILGVLATLTVAAYLSHAKGVYYAHVSVVFLAPGNKSYGNVLTDDQSAVVHFAAVVERELDGNVPQLKLASSASPLYGAGVRSGYSISLRDNGGQWQTNFNQPILDVQVVDRSADAVRRRMNELVQHIHAKSDDIQASAGLPSTNFIQPISDSSMFEVVYVAGSRSRMVASVIMLGASITGLSVGFLRRRLGRQDQHRTFRAEPAVRRGSGLMSTN